MVFKGTQVGSKLVHRSILFLIIVFGLMLRFSNYEFFYANFFDHFNFFDPDSYYHLRRLVYFLENFPKSLSFDPLIDWPRGGAVDWPDFSLWLYGLPLKIFGAASFKSLELGASLLSIFYGMFTAVFIYLGSKKILDRDFQILVLFLAVLNPLLIRYSCLGQVDHHIFEILWIGLSFWACFKAFEERREIFAASLGAMWALGFGISSSSIFCVLAFSIGISIVWGERERLRIYVLMFVSFFLTYAGVALWHSSRWSSPFDLKMPSLFQGLASLFVLTVCSVPFLLARRRSRFYASLGILLVCGLIVFSSPFQMKLNWAFSYVFEKRGIIQYVIEANPLVFNFGEWDFHFGFQNLSFLFPLFILSPFALLRWRKLNSSERFLLLTFCVLLVPALMQRRFTHFMLPLYLIISVWLLRSFISWLQAKQIRLANLMSLAFVCMFLMPSFKYGFSLEPLAAHRVDFNLMRYFMKEAEIQVEEAWQQLAEPDSAEKGIWANPNLGHLLSYVTGYGVLTNPFYHGAGLHKDFELRTLKSKEEFLQKVQEYKIKYAFILNDFQYFEMLHHLKEQDTSYFIDTRGESKTFQIDQIEKFVWVDLLLRPEEQLPKSRDILSLQFMENYFYNYARVIEFD